MNDFDFEELDKAVNALADKTQEEHGGDSVSSVPPATQPISRPLLDTKPVSPEPIVNPSESQPEPKAVEPPPTREAEVPKRARLSEVRPHSRGAFMDIVTPASRKPSARGIALQPVTKPQDIVPAPKPLEEKGLSELEATEPTKDSKPESSEIHESNDTISWPDPLDLQDDEPKKEDASPFLAEAKVEKRPLGAFSSFQPAKEANVPEEAAVEAKSEQPVADELTPDEKGLFEEPKEAPKSPDKQPETKEPELEADKEPPKPDLHGAAMMSIPQQYHTEAKATDKSTRSVFDTKEYHPPLLEAAVHDHRGGSMWSKIFIAFVVLALLAVAGYFAYIYFVQH